MALVVEAGAEEKALVPAEAGAATRGREQPSPLFSSAMVKAIVTPELQHAAQLGAAFRAVQEARDAAEYWRANRELLEVAVQGFDAADALDRPADRRIPQAPGTATPAPGTEPDPLGGATEGIDDRLRKPKPRGWMVGPGSMPGPEQLVGHMADLTIHPDGSSTYHSSVGNTTTTVDYDTNGQLVGYTETVVTKDQTQHTVGVLVLDEHGNPYIKETTVEKTGDGVVEKETTVRPHSRESDPPVFEEETPPREEDVAGSMTGEEGSGGGGSGWCNPITGHCHDAGIAVSGDRVRPARDAAPTGGARLVFDPEILVINPDPAVSVVRGRPGPLPDSKTPGARPPDPLE